MATGGPELVRTKRCGPEPPCVRPGHERRTNMAVLCEVSAEELARIEGGYFLKFVWID